MNTSTLSLVQAVCLLTMVTTGALAESGKYDPDLENPISTVPGYETYNKAKDKLNSISQSYDNAKRRLDEMIGVRPKEPDYSDPNYTPESNDPPPTEPARSATPSPAWTPPPPTAEQALNNRKRMLDIMSIQAQKDAADYAAMRAKCGFGPESREECLKNLEQNFALRHTTPVAMMPEEVERMRVQEGMPAKADLGTSGDPLLHQMFDDQTTQSAPPSLEGIMDAQSRSEAAQEAQRRQQEEQQRQLAEQQRQRQEAAQRAQAAQQAQDAQRIQAQQQAQQQAESAAQMQTLMNAFSMGINAAAAARRPAPVPTYIPPPSMPSYQGTTSAPSSNTYTAPRQSPTYTNPPASSGSSNCGHPQCGIK